MMICAVLVAALGYLDLAEIAVGAYDGVAEFVYFLLGHGADGAEGLLGVPGAFLAQLVHDVQQPAESLGFFFFGVHR